MRRFLLSVALLALLTAGGFGLRNVVFAQDATPVGGETPISAETTVPEASPTVAVAGNLTTLVVIEHATSDTTIDLGEDGDSIGDLLAFANEVFDETDTQQVGTDQGSCVRVIPGEAYECAWTLTLDDGQIMVQGPFLDGSTSTLAITGGTGAYLGVSGQMTLRPLSDTEFEFTYEFL
jgi:allene oxide cyclase